MPTQENIRYLFKTLADSLPKMEADLKQNFEDVALTHFEFLKSTHPDTPLSCPAAHHVFFFMKGEIAISYVYFYMASSQLRLWGVFTSKRERGHGLALEGLKEIICSDIASSFNLFSIVFSSNPTNEIQGLHNSFIKWFCQKGPSYKRLTVYHNKTVFDYVAGDEERNQKIFMDFRTLEFPQK